MRIASEILSLRRNRASSVETLLAALEWEKAAHDDEHILSRGYAVREAADLVLLNVAVHAAELLMCEESRRTAFAFGGYSADLIPNCRRISSLNSAFCSSDICSIRLAASSSNLRMSLQVPRQCSWVIL